MKKAKAILIILACIATLSGTAIAGKAHTTKDGFFAAIYKHNFDKAVEICVAKDMQAFRKMFDDKRIFLLKPGLKVYLIDYKFSGVVKVRPAGETIEFWTFSEALD